MTAQGQQREITMTEQKIAAPMPAGTLSLEEVLLQSNTSWRAKRCRACRKDALAR
jgi:hypothetical protein